MSSEARRAALAAALPDDVDAMLVTALVNVRYLTGFTGSNGAVLVDRGGDAWLATDGRYTEQAGHEAPDLPLLTTRTLAPDLLRAASRRGSTRFAIERHSLTLTAYDGLVDAADGAVFVDGHQVVEQLRVHKDAEEITRLRSACTATDEAFTSMLAWLRPGVSEQDTAWFLLEQMLVAGAEAAAFDSIVAFGPHSAVPHHNPTGRVLQRGDLVKVDFGARVDGYHADMTRCVVCGPPADWQRDLHAQVVDVQRRCREQTVIGADPAELDAQARHLVGETGHELVHGLGHGVGLEIHEAPFMVPGTTAARLDDRVAVTVEPGIYLPGRGGIRIEDTMLVGPGGSEPLTTSTRELIEI